MWVPMWMWMWMWMRVCGCGCGCGSTEEAGAPASDRGGRSSAGSGHPAEGRQCVDVEVDEEVDVDVGVDVEWSSGFDVDV